MDLLEAEHERPNNVWLLVEIDEGGKPAARLAIEDFTFSEDGAPIGAAQSQQTLLNINLAVAMHTMVLVDLSGSLAEGRRAELGAAVRKLTEEVLSSERVGVYGFDGSEVLHPLLPFEEPKPSVAMLDDALARYTIRDRSTNLHGAVITAARTLHAALEKDPRKVKIGTLLVITDNVDKASRARQQDMFLELQNERYAGYRFYAVGASALPDIKFLEKLGRDGAEIVGPKVSLEAAVDGFGKRIATRRDGMYLVSYCSLSRAGKHTVKLEARRTQGKRVHKRSVTYELDADQFGPPPACSPYTLPPFARGAPAPSAAGGAAPVPSAAPSVLPSAAPTAAPSAPPAKGGRK